jgi:hypothetical protein
LVALRDEVFTITSRPPVFEFTCLHQLVFWDIGNQSRAWASLAIGYPFLACHTL